MTTNPTQIHKGYTIKNWNGSKIFDTNFPFLFSRMKYEVTNLKDYPKF